MSANINSLMYVGERPWHGLGTRLEKSATAEEALQAAGLNWSVSAEPVFLENAENPIPNRYAVVRNDTRQPLGIVGNRYIPLQNKDSFRFFDAVVGVKEAIYHTAGALGRGEIIWILAKLNGVVRVVGDDITEKYLLLTNRHDGTGSVKVMWTPIRVVCQNTLNAALEGEANELHSSLRHTASLGLKVDHVRQALGIINAKFDLFENAAKRLAAAQLNRAAWRSYLERLGLAPQPNQESSARQSAEKLMEQVSVLFEHGKGNDLPGVKGTVWGGYNAVVEFVDYCRKSRGGDECRTKSLLFGTGADLKRRAWREALAVSR